MTDYEKCAHAFEISRTEQDKENTKGQIKVWVRAGRITAEEYEEITGDPYVD